MKTYFVKPGPRAVFFFQASRDIMGLICACGNDRRYEPISNRLRYPRGRRGVVCYYDGNFFPAHPGHAETALGVWDRLFAEAASGSKAEPLGIYLAPWPYEVVQATLGKDAVGERHRQLMLHALIERMPCTMLYQCSSLLFNDSSTFLNMRMAAIMDFHSQVSEVQGLRDVRLTVVLIQDLDTCNLVDCLTMKARLPFLRIVVVNNTLGHYDKIQQLHTAGIELVERMPSKISSSTIRDAARRGLDLSYFYPEQGGWDIIAAYIKQYALWCNVPAPAGDFATNGGSYVQGA